MKELFGKSPDGEDVYLYTLKNKNGMIVKIMNYGGTVCSILFPDKDGKVEDMVLGYKDFEGYLSENNPYFGSLVGRYANRIANGQFKLNGNEYNLAKNNGPNHLHGGVKAFDKLVWQAKERATTLELEYFSKDGEEGYPGNLKVKVVYSLTQENELKINYEAETNAETHVNLTNHSYFNLCGNAKRNVLEHEVKIMANAYTPVTEALIPTGELTEVDGTALNFKEFKKIGEEIGQVDGGYDHNYVLNPSKTFCKKIAEVKENESGRMLEVYTSEPGVQFYTPNFQDGSIVGKEGAPYNSYLAFCLETQHFPDSPNQPDFPSTLLKPGNTYKQETIYKFSLID